MNEILIWCDAFHYVLAQKLDLLPLANWLDTT